MIFDDRGIEPNASKSFSFDEGTLTIDVFDRVIKPGEDAGIYSLLRRTVTEIEPIKDKEGYISDNHWHPDLNAALHEFDSIELEVAKRIMTELYQAYHG